SQRSQSTGFTVNFYSGKLYFCKPPFPDLNNILSGGFDFEILITYLIPVHLYSAPLYGTPPLTVRRDKPCCRKKLAEKQFAPFRRDGYFGHVVRSQVITESFHEAFFSQNTSIGPMVTTDNLSSELFLGIHGMNIMRLQTQLDLLYIGKREVGKQFVIPEHEVVRDRHDLPEDLVRRIIDTDIIPQRL